MRNMKILAATLAALPSIALAEITPQPLALRAAADYLQQARYPDASTVLEVGSVDPVVDTWTPTRQSRPGPNGAGPRLTVWASSVSVLPGESVSLYATLTHAGKAQSLIESAPAKGSVVTDATVTGELVGEHLGTLGTVAYRDDGKGADTLAGDGVYTASFTMPAAKAPKLGYADSVLVRVAATLADGDERKAAGGVLYSNPAARLTGRFTDSIRDGNLVVAAEIEVLAAGRVHVAGTLADAAGAPFATAQNAGHRTPGKQWIELDFYGLAFHDRGISGAASLASVVLTSANGMPNAVGPVLTSAHTTAAYNLAQFTSAPFNHPELLEAARRLQLSAPVAAPAVVPALR